MEKIDKLELELERELSPLISKLRSNYMELDELEAQGSYDPTKVKKIWCHKNSLLFLRMKFDTHFNSYTPHLSEYQVLA